MTTSLPLLVLCWLAAAQAQEGPGTDPSAADPAPEARPDDPAPPETLAQEERGRLDAAIGHYISGDPALARDELLLLLAEPQRLDDALHREARIWLGEILYTLGDVQAAHSAFEVVVLTWPETRLDPFVHPPEVVALYDSVRAAVEVARVIPPERPPAELPARERPSVLLTALPGGLQFYNQKPALGGITLGTVTALGMTTVGMRLWLAAQDSVPGQRGIQLEGDSARLAELRRFRAVENTLGFATVALWGAAVAQGVVQVQVQGSTRQVAVGPAGVNVRF